MGLQALRLAFFEGGAEVQGAFDITLSEYDFCGDCLWNSSLDKIGSGFALEQNRPLVENWGYDDSNFYQREH